ncbi:MAG: M48 family metallopeptidase [Pseudomonadota bacterium]
MNFFEHQDQARKRTTQLVVLFGLAVLTLIAMTIVLVALFTGIVGADPEQGFRWQDVARQLDPATALYVALGVLIVVGGGSLYKLNQLRGGGRVVAEMMGGRKVYRDKATPREKVLLNVVEEMAIASGTPVPAVYVIDDSAINAFAAGFTPDDAVIGVTRGIIEKLDRDELQGVMAHEFSHITHGDMRLNIHLMGVLHGILVIGLIGYHLLDKLWWTAGSRRSSNDKGGHIGIIAFAVGLIVIGFGGVFFGNIIKSAVSRQREYLADASAVQFTRNPEGISGALKKIGGNAAGSALGVNHAKEASHMFFGEVSHKFADFTGVFATHPPLDDRIRRIEPRWDGEFVTPTALRESEADRPREEDKPEGLDKLLGDEGLGRVLGSTMGAAALAESAMSQVGTPGPQQLQAAREMLGKLPEMWVRQSHDLFGARAVVYALLLDDEPNVREHQRQHIRNLDGIVDKALRDLLDAPAPDEEHKLTLIDMAMPQLAEMQPDTREAFEQCMDALIRANRKISLFEWAIQRMIGHYLTHQFDSPRPPKPRHRKLKAVTESVRIMLATLAVADTDNSQREAAFQAGCERAGLELDMPAVSELGLKPLNRAVDNLNHLYPLAKPVLLKACIATITADGEITPRERELVRAVSDLLECPMPPLKM